MALGLHMVRNLPGYLEQDLERHYLSLEAEMAQLGQYQTMYGTESLTSDAFQVARNLSYRIAGRLGDLTARLMRTLKNSIQQMFLRRDYILKLWNDRLREQHKYVDEARFQGHRLNIVDFRVLEQRIGAIDKVHFILDNVERICDAPLHTGSDDWRTPEFLAAYRAMQDIGFDANKFNLVKKASSEYENAEYKAPLGEHGYNVHQLANLVSHLQVIAKYANDQYLHHLSDRIIRYSETLTDYERALRGNNDMDEETRQTRLRQVEVKIARLWWATHFLKAQFQVMRDVTNDIFRLCRIAEQYIDKTRVGTESLYEIPAEISPEELETPLDEMTDPDESKSTEALWTELYAIHDELLAVTSQYQQLALSGMESCERVAMEGLRERFTALVDRLKKGFSNVLYRFVKELRESSQDNQIFYATIDTAKKWENRIKPHLSDVDPTEFKEATIHKYVMDYKWLIHCYSAIPKFTPLCMNFRELVMQPMPLNKIQMPKQIEQAIEDLKRWDIRFHPSRERGRYIVDYDDFNDHLIRNVTLGHLGYDIQHIGDIIQRSYTICKSNLWTTMEQNFQKYDKISLELYRENRNLESQFRDKSHDEIAKIQQLHALRWGWLSTMLEITHAACFSIPKMCMATSVRVFSVVEDVIRIKK